MVTRVWAVWFVVLTALPFTAPFATLDVADLLGRAHTPTALATVSALRACSPDDSADDVVTSYANGHRVLPTARGGLTPMRSPVAYHPIPPTVALVSSPGSAPPTGDVSALVVTLRL